MINSIIKNITLFRLTILSIIFFSGGIEYFSIFITTLIPTAFITWLYIKEQVKIHSALITPIVILFFYFFYTFIISTDVEDIIFIGYRAVRFLMAIAVVNYIFQKKINIINELNIVLKWLLLHGIANFLIVNLFFVYFTPIPETNASHFLFFFGTGNELFYFQRNQGIFWEPGVFQIYLNLLLFINLFYKEKIILSWIILIIILTTFSTTGMVLAFAQIVFYYIIHMKMGLNKIILMVVFGPALYGYYLATENIVLDKIEGSSQGSYMSRSFDTKNGFIIAINHPYGIGFSTKKYQDMAAYNVYNIESEIDTNRGNTNSISTLFYSTGIFWGVFFMFFTYSQKIYRKYKLLFFCIIIVSLSSEPLYFSTFFLIFPISGMINKKYLF